MRWRKKTQVNYKNGVVPYSTFALHISSGYIITNFRDQLHCSTASCQRGMDSWKLCRTWLISKLWPTTPSTWRGRCFNQSTWSFTTRWWTWVRGDILEFIKNNFESQAIVSAMLPDVMHWFGCELISSADLCVEHQVCSCLSPCLE